MTNTVSELEGLAGLAIGKLRSFLDGAEPTTKDIAEARVATSVLNSWVRLEQARGAREATTFMIARELAQDREQLQEYVNRALPSSPFAKIAIEA